MRKIIKNKMYDTDTAKELATYSNYGDWRDFNHYKEALYQKRTGEFFLFGVGGPRTQYAEQIGQRGWTGGKKIIPLTYDSAREWAEEHLDAGEYEDIFGEVAEDESRTQLCLSISTAAAEKIRRMAQESGQTISDYVESMVKTATDGAGGK